MLGENGSEEESWKGLVDSECLERLEISYV